MAAQTNFIDIATIWLHAGKGGDGAVSFHREKFVAAGGPDGGDGGRGGDIIFVVDDHLTTLMDFRYKRKYVAPEGGKGGASLCHGKNAENLVIKVPLGTVIKDAESGLVIADLSDHTPVTIAKGGRGGYGNAHFATPTRQIPKFAKPGMPGEDIQVTLELKLIADVGLIGFPNVGKSTLISTISAAKPKIANYHFTTLVPTLGVVSVAEGASFVCADIPGLIEGASEGIGLGHDFLRHVERCRLLLHVVDVSGSECREPIEDFEKINEELAKFSPVLAERPQIVIGNKCDLATEEQIEAFRKYVEGKGLTFVPISAATMQGVKELPGLVYNRLKDIPCVERGSPVAGIHSGRQQCGRLRKPAVLPASAGRERHSGRSGGKGCAGERHHSHWRLPVRLYLLKKNPLRQRCRAATSPEGRGFTHLKSTCNKSSPFRGSWRADASLRGLENIYERT